jgi:translation initiation factor eIF-2B subunit delta
LIVSHLPPPKPSSSVSATLKGDVHPSIIKLGLQLRSGAIRGANARCIAGLLAFKNVILAYRTPQSTTLPRDLTTHLSPQIAHLTAVRAMPVGLGNAIRWLKYEISTISIDEAEADVSRAFASRCIRGREWASKGFVPWRWAIAEEKTKLI